VSAHPDPAAVRRWLAVEPVAPLADADLPRVSIVILNWNGRHHLGPCFETLRALDYPRDRFEVVLVDNGSDDGSQAEVRAKHGWVRLVENARNVGFAAGCNQGALEAKNGPLRPTQVVFLNNDIHVDKGFLRALVAPVTAGVAIASTAKMFSWDGSVLNSAGGGMNFHGLGLQRGYLEAPAPEYDGHRKSLFACGGAMAMDLDAFFEVGGFDEEFFAYYEDVDLGWRTWVHGYEVHYEPRAVCYHHHSSTSRRVPLERLRLLQVRNPLLACFKNYDDENLRRVLPAMLALATRRAFLRLSVEDLGTYRIENMATLGPHGPVAGLWGRFKRKLDGREVVDKVSVADLVGMNDLLGRWDHWMARRAVVQAKRRRPDDQILPLFLRPLWCIEDEGGYKELHSGVSQFMGLDTLFDGLTTLTQEPPR
jgi:GT2 family glycosyltransferase